MMNLMRTFPLAPRRSVLNGAAAAFVAFTSVTALASTARADNGEWFPPQAGAPQAPQPQPPDDAQADPADDASQAAQQQDEYQDNDPSALTDFRAPLAPYGTWTDDPSYGTVWVPDATQVGNDFAPYQTEGQWGVTSSGDWLWQSNYSWGYIPFHYGRWVWTGNSWGWIAGRRYSPAWVAWRTGENGYVGWAPLPPAYRWAGRRAVGLSSIPLAPFCFVGVNYAFMPGVSSYVVRDRGAIASIAASTHPYRPSAVGVASGRSSPMLSEAHIPASASPRSAARMDGRSLAYATPSSTAAVRAGRTLNVGGSSYRGVRASTIPASHGSYSTYNHLEAAGAGRGGGSFTYVHPESHVEARGGQPGVGGARGAHPSGVAAPHPPAYQPPAAAAPAASHASVSHGGGGVHRR